MDDQKIKIFQITNIVNNVVKILFLDDRILTFLEAFRIDKCPHKLTHMGYFSVVLSYSHIKILFYFNHIKILLTSSSSQSILTNLLIFVFSGLKSTLVSLAFLTIYMFLIY